MKKAIVNEGKVFLIFAVFGITLFPVILHYLLDETGKRDLGALYRELWHDLREVDPVVIAALMSPYAAFVCLRTLYRRLWCVS